MSPLSPEKMKLGENVEDVSRVSMNWLIKLRLMHINSQLKNAIERENGRDLQYLLGCLNLYKFHSDLSCCECYPFDVLLLSKKRCSTVERGVNKRQESEEREKKNRSTKPKRNSRRH
ncbi:hypothetical protein EHI8A_086050 [Entamoeba histolytica HM-1:IMSS-B]|uniref:Uncharacterized protein n=6 Tax=Entamoeba histolytica TaxID=5759 RepID=C4LZK3_ENTH1|nr:hypothetical protein EHI_174550 [Entamoeba histolytica HM-1:IMSS]EMD45939.1 Hypothetical protein EHI5A_102500 [Entamoeba histolytica KU27]EMH76837.1 hypothetical protein EHI8A_086050 [Entamoeba histolytica HM-1:IMSS-B]EMS13403.1 hypothetical protein KM1_102040 [Entamoeba histolytica HM-3:IMSS]ENY65823.1 hypothetical protein EHI7A_075770 [Entamoeba histolytica HM-1:IMSS-A]GAT94301.1 hypothetical protein CL6EHI_174550 [Entamoeba histolytica]|eukprot:XP_653323.1 hypothetical protein EHI_174550 [Entamoeba histolytica HM-1:IMSS]